jgi:hypothetical protein
VSRKEGCDNGMCDFHLVILNAKDNNLSVEIDFKIDLEKIASFLYIINLNKSSWHYFRKMFKNKEGCMKSMSILIIIIIIFINLLNECNAPLSIKNDIIIKPSILIENDTIWPSKGVYHLSNDHIIKAFLAIGDSSNIYIEPNVLVSIGSSSTKAILSIGKGSTIFFGKNARLEIWTNGSLIAHGGTASRITFTRDSSAQFWGSSQGGICLKGGYQDGGQLSLTHCIVEYATTGIYDSSYSGEKEISYCTIQNCENSGVVFDFSGPKDSASFLNNTITKNGSYPIRIKSTGVENLSGTGNFSGNSKDGIFVDQGYIRSYAVWRKHNVPYIVKGIIDISASIDVSLTIRPGCRLEFVPDDYYHNSGIFIGQQGTLIAEGTGSDSIVFTKSILEKDFSDTSFSGISIKNGAFWGSVLKYCIIEKASTGISVNVPIELSYCTIRKCFHNGVVFSTDEYFGIKDTGCPKDSNSFLYNKISENNGFPISIMANNVGKLSGTGYFIGNKNNGILVIGEKVTRNAFWKNHNLPYVIDGCVNISNNKGVKVTIQAGNRIEFTKIGSYIDIGSEASATIVANGTAANPIVFTKSGETTWWGAAQGGILIGGLTDQSSSFDFCEISFATTGIFLKNKITISNCRIYNNRQYGVDLLTADLENSFSKVTFENNTLGDIRK